MSKNQEKLIYEEQFGFPFYSLLKRLLPIYGDLEPSMSTIKVLHSQIQLFYSQVFADKTVNRIRAKSGAWEKSITEYLFTLFPSECHQFSKFIKFYKNLRKQ